MVGKYIYLYLSNIVESIKTTFSPILRVSCPYWTIFSWKSKSKYKYKYLYLYTLIPLE